MLEFIVVPSVKIVTGYKTQIVVLADGRVVTRTVQSQVMSADARTQTRIQKDDIDDRIASGVSTMPRLANLLTVDDVRHLIAYLVTLRETSPD